MLKKETVNLETGESIIENLSADELKIAAEMENLRLAAIEEATRKEAERLKVLEKLGLTLDEAKALFG